MAKHLRYTDEARKKLLAGADKLAHAVGITLGPTGRNVILDKSFGGPTVTKYGVSVSKEIEPSDPFENMGAKLVNAVAQKTSDVAGDGTTTATILALAIFQEGLRSITAGANPMAVRRGIDKGVDAAVKTLEGMSKKVSKKAEIEQVASISANNDPTIGKLMADAFEKVGKDGVITVEEGKTSETTLEFVEGMQFDKGYITPYFVTDPTEMRCELEDCYILIYEKKLANVREMLPLLEKIHHAGRPLLIIAEDVESKELAALVVNRLRGVLQVCAVKAPGFGDRRKAMLGDIAVLTGGQFISDDLGLKLENVTLDQLGRAKTVRVEKENTTIVGGAGKKQDITRRIEQIRAQMNQTDSEYDNEKFSERLAKLTGGVAIIRVGAATEADMKQKKAGVEDALHATRAAVAEGILPGGGVALIRAMPAVEAVAKKLEHDERFGAEIVVRALEKPLRTIAENTGVDGGVVADQVKVRGKRSPNVGYDANTGEYVDMYRAGIVDPTRVTRSALQSAASISGLMLTTVAMVAADQGRATRLVESGASVYESSGDVISAVVEQAISARDSVEQAIASVEQAIAKEAPPAATPRPQREVSTGFSSAAPPFDAIDRDQPLFPGQDHLFWLEVGPPVAGSIELKPTELDVTALPADAVLQVVLFAFPGEIECLGTKGELLLGRDGSVRVARQPSELAAEVPAELRERRLFFPVRTPVHEGNFKLRCHVYHGAVLLQSRVIEAAVRSITAPLPRALSARIDYVRSPSLAPAALARVEPVEMSILLNDNGHGTHSLRFFGREQWASDAHFEGDELKQLIDLVRSTLHEVSWGAPGPWDDRLTYKYPNGRGEREQLRADLSRLAKTGFRLYAAIRDRLSGDLSPAQLREKLRPSIRIQVAHHESARLYLPASLLYDSPINTARSSFTLCPEFVTALDQHVELHATPCFTEGCPNANKLDVVCPSGFWGFRHVLGLPLSVGHGPDPASEIPAGPSGRTFLAAVSLELDHASPLEHMRNLGFHDGWNYRVSESRDEAVELFQTAGPHVVYLYCHGGVDMNGIVYVSLGRTDPAAPEANRITFDNLTAYEIDWGRSSPLVFLNGCRTAVPRPDRVMDLISDFVRVARASGVIGTEITIFESLACRFAPACLRPFLQGVQLGDAVRRARLEVLAAQNPLGLVYVPYAPHDLRFAKVATVPASRPDAA